MASLFDILFLASYTFEAHFGTEVYKMVQKSLDACKLLTGIAPKYASDDSLTLLKVTFGIIVFKVRGTLFALKADFLQSAFC